MRIKNLAKLPKRKVTVDDLLVNDDVKDILEDVCQRTAEIEDIIIIYSQKDGDFYHSYSGHKQKIVYYLEQVKHNLLTELEPKED